MSIHPAVGSDVEILLSDGNTWMTLSLVEETNSDGFIAPKTLEQRLSALLVDRPLGQTLEPTRWTNRALGIGLDYNVAYGLYTRTPGIVIPAGSGSASTITALNNSNSPLVAIEEIGPALVIAQRGDGGANTARVIYSSDGTGSAAGAWVNGLNLGANEYMRDLCLFGVGTGGGARYIYASSSDVNGLNGRLHRSATGASGSWTSTAAATFGTMGLNRMWRVYWTDRDGNSYPRLVTISRPNMIAYTDVGADPFSATAWIEVEIDTAKTLLDLGGAKRHVYFRAQDNVFDFNELGESPALMSFDSESSSDGALQYLKDYLYVGTGRTLNRIYVGSPTLTQQDAVNQCSPGWGTPAENDVRGVITAMTTDQGYLVAAVHNSTVAKSFICYASDQGVPSGSANPLLWFGPEGFFDSDWKVTRMKTSALSGSLRLWISIQQASSPLVQLYWTHLPLAGAPLQELISGGAMRFVHGAATGNSMNGAARLELLPTAWKGATAIVDQATLVTRSLSIVRSADGSTVNDNLGTKLIWRVKADPPAGAITWPSGADVTITPSQTVTPPAATAGERFWQRIDFISPEATALIGPKIGVLDICEVRAWVASPTMVSLPLTVQYGEGIRTLVNGDLVSRDPDWVSDQLSALTTSGRTTLKTRDGKRWPVKVVQSLDRSTTYATTGAYAGKTVTAHLLVQVLGAAS